MTRDIYTIMSNTVSCRTTLSWHLYRSSLVIISWNFTMYPLVRLIYSVLIYTMRLWSKTIIAGITYVFTRYVIPATAVQCVQTIERPVKRASIYMIVPHTSKRYYFVKFWQKIHFGIFSSDFSRVKNYKQ